MKEIPSFNLNQNLWLLLIALSGLGASEHFCLGITKIFSIILVSMATLSMAITLFAYTLNYVKRKSKS